VTVYYSNDTSATYNMNRGNRQNLLTGGTQGGPGTETMYIVADKPIFANSQADGDGSETYSFMPIEDLASEYLISNASQYAVVATMYSGTVTLYDGSGNIVDQQVAAPTPGYPDYLFFGAT